MAPASVEESLTSLSGSGDPGCAAVQAVYPLLTAQPVREGMAMPTRRDVLAGCVSIAAAASSGRAVAAPPLTLVEPYGPNSSTGQAAALIGPGLAGKFRTGVDIAHMAGDAGGRALDHVAHSPADGKTLLVTQLLSRYAMFEDAQAAPDAPSYRRMTPVALLTPAISAALVVSHGSPIVDWENFAQRAGAGEVRMAHNPIMLFAVPLGMLEAHFERRFVDVLATTRAEMIAALDEGRAEAGLLPTISLLTPDGRPPLRPILTFGGGRNQWFAGVPTYREVGKGVRTAITGAIAMFGPPGMAAGRQAELTRAVADAGDDPDIVAAAAARRYPLRIAGPDELRRAMDRCARVIRDMRPYLRASEAP